MLGAPVSTSLERWALARSSVSGRLINGFSSRDWILGLVYRGGNGARPIVWGDNGLRQCVLCSKLQIL